MRCPIACRGEGARGLECGDERVGGVGVDREEQAARRLRVGEEQLLGSGEVAPVDVRRRRTRGCAACRRRPCPRATSSRTPSITGTGRGRPRRRRPTPRSISRRCPSRPKPVTSVAAWTPHRERRVARARVERRHDVGRPSPAARRSPRRASPRCEITPSPIGFVSTRTSPGRPPRCVSTRSGSTVADDGEPVLRLGVVDRVAAQRSGTPASRRDVGAAVEHPGEQLEREALARPGRRGSARAAACRPSRTRRRARWWRRCGPSRTGRRRSA